VAFLRGDRERECSRTKRMCNPCWCLSIMEYASCPSRTRRVGHFWDEWRWPVVRQWAFGLETYRQSLIGLAVGYFSRYSFALDPCLFALLYSQIFQRVELEPGVQSPHNRVQKMASPPLHRVLTFIPCSSRIRSISILYCVQAALPFP
jgi:hypothetical protein